MQRILLLDLIKWAENPVRTPLLLRGARQVGKTHVVRQLGKKFKHFVEINFEKNPELKKIFEHDFDPKRIVRELSLVTGQNIEPKKTLLFIDEIQEQSRAIIALRYFYEEMQNLHVIAAGSLVDFAIEQVGVPVGRISFLYMYPMSFVEYLVATGNENLAIEIVQHQPEKEMNEAIHSKLLRIVGEYTAIGGMPQAVNQWISSGKVDLAGNILQNIKNAYEQDFAKYAKKNQIKYIELLFKKIPNLICRNFKYTQISTDYRKRELEPALELLEKAGIIHKVNHSSGNGLPLGAEMNIDKFKTLYLDVGLVQAILGLNLKDWFVNSNEAFINKGNITEQFVGQELLAYASATDRQNLFYWHRDEKSSSAEVDYLTVHKHRIVPIEVKSGAGTSLKSMHMFLDLHKDSPYGIRFSVHNYSSFDRIKSYPLYAVAGIIEDKEKLLEFLHSLK